jgi:chorismate lyase / 3-hydroxybenzoate synthase
MSNPSTSAGSSSQLSHHAPRIELLPEGSASGDALLEVGFGSSAAPHRVSVPLESLSGRALVETWSASGPVSRGEQGPIHFSHDDHFLAASLTVPEKDHGDLIATTAFAYRAIANFTRGSSFPHLLRMWNYFDAINAGVGDGERYRGFCTGRVAGLRDHRQPHHPAATVIGRTDGERLLRVYWLAGRAPGIALENPRQVSAFRYPRQYGETSPTFSRAMLVSPELLLISGTASIVGHESTHAGDVSQQVREILANLESLMVRAHALAPALPPRFGPGTQIRAYVRHREDRDRVEELLDAKLPGCAPVMLVGDVCRRDLLVEFDCLHRVAGAGG